MLVLQPLELKAKLYRGFADSSRLAISEALRQGSLTVGQIVEATGLSQSNASNHLGCLCDCGLAVGIQPSAERLWPSRFRSA